MKNNKGLTLLEIIFIMVIAGVAIPALIMAYAYVVGEGVDARSAITATNIAQEKMEEIIKGTEFADLVTMDSEAQFVFDPNAGTAQNICSYSAADAGYCPPTYGCPEDNPNCYNYRIVVTYVDGYETAIDGDGVDLDNPVTGTNPDVGDADRDGFTDDATDFKQVQMVITKDNFMGFSLTMTTVIANVGY